MISAHNEDTRERLLMKKHTIQYLKRGVGKNEE